MNDAERDHRQEMEYQRAAKTYMRMQTMRMKFFYAGIYFKIFVLLLLIAVGLLAWRYPHVVMGWWDEITGRIEHWININI